MEYWKKELGEEAQKEHLKDPEKLLEKSLEKLQSVPKKKQI